MASQRRLLSQKGECVGRLSEVG
ncbi:uncharacterized protein G2W53_027414 [Senna tora]|uniref:Uncharacterized protein n=1 Tax=Senna tora TaxID=362788 RepID=A0A834WM76_9FABA|nr:uncharacterized protein G2W53_027414 [Senna tora]